MRVLAATGEVDPRDGGFSFTVPGELLGPPAVCEKPGCGCRWSFPGLSSEAGTSLAVVADRPGLHGAVYSGLGGDPWLAEVAASYEPGTLLVGWFPRGGDARIMPLAEWIDRYGLAANLEDPDEPA